VPRFSFVLDVRDPPATVMEAMLDFSERRPEIWPNLAARMYRVHELGPAAAPAAGSPSTTAVGQRPYWDGASARCCT
jgi:hypothetical protein